MGFTTGNSRFQFRVRLAATACDAFWNVCVGNSPAGASLSGNNNPYRGGYNVGGGVNLGSGTKFFVETRYHHMFTTKSPRS